MWRVCRPQGFPGDGHAGILRSRQGIRGLGNFATEGIFMAVTCHAPKFIDETIAQAGTDVGRGCTILSKNIYQAETAIACVNEDICSGCGICKTVFSYNAIEIVANREKSKALVTDALCKDCDACAAAYPSGAMAQKGFKSTQLWQWLTRHWSAGGGDLYPNVGRYSKFHLHLHGLITADQCQ